jgi:alpha,alpha-trehalose phosphorylase
VPAQELADRCRRTLQRARTSGVVELRQEQRQWLEDFWAKSDVEVDGDEGVQQAVRWSLFQLAQASACTNEFGIAAKGLTGGGYDGHYFWDTEVYVLPFLAYTNPNAARKVLRYRWHMLEKARERADELSQRGALYPWRTINGEEASAYYAAGTAQYHINAAISYAIERYSLATGDIDFLAGEGAEVLVETARLWEDLGFYSLNGNDTFHIHGVTGPDEYTTVVNDNLYTNVMARFNMEYAVSTAELLAESDPETYAALCRRTGLTSEEIAGWRRAAGAMYLKFDTELGIHPQDENFLERERWDIRGTPADKYPLLLHFHPLVIYRHQVLKQADVVLAMYLRPEHFDIEQKRRNFDYYDPLTTGDSSLSACVQSIVAAEVGRDDLALDYFLQAVYLDLQDMHGNTADGAHIANAGGVWATLMHGFAGMVDTGQALRFTPRVPQSWNGIRLRLVRHQVLAEIEVDHKQCTVRVLDGGPLPVETADGVAELFVGEELSLPIDTDRGHWERAGQPGLGGT